jgi:hypothetical protein
MQSINNPLPIFFMNKDGLNEIHEGRIKKVFERVTMGVDLAKPFTDYGCATVWEKNDKGELELKHVEYLERRNG